jgi:hypothetical protein
MDNQQCIDQFALDCQGFIGAMSNSFGDSDISDISQDFEAFAMSPIADVRNYTRSSIIESFHKHVGGMYNRIRNKDATVFYAMANAPDQMSILQKVDLLGKWNIANEDDKACIFEWLTALVDSAELWATGHPNLPSEHVHNLDVDASAPDIRASVVNQFTKDTIELVDFIAQNFGDPTIHNTYKALQGSLNCDNIDERNRNRAELISLFHADMNGMYKRVHDSDSTIFTDMAARNGPTMPLLRHLDLGVKLYVPEGTIISDTQSHVFKLLCKLSECAKEWSYFDMVPPGMMSKIEHMALSGNMNIESMKALMNDISPSDIQSFSEKMIQNPSNLQDLMAAMQHNIPPGIDLAGLMGGSDIGQLTDLLGGAGGIMNILGTVNP